MQGSTNWTAWSLIAPIADLQVEHQGRFHARPSMLDAFILPSIVKHKTCFIHISATWHRHMLHIFSIKRSYNIVEVLKKIAIACITFCLVNWVFLINIVAKQHIIEIYRQWINKCKPPFFNGWMPHCYVCIQNQLHLISWKLTQMQCVKKLNVKAMCNIALI